MEKKINAHMEEVEEKGGMIKAVESGYIQEQVSYQAYLYEKKIQSGEIPKIAVNKYISKDEENRDIEFHPYNTAAAEEQKRRLLEVKAGRDNSRVKETLAELKKAAQTKDNLMPYILKAVRSYATLGEMTGIFRDVFGEFREPHSVTPAAQGAI
jgi:methylmalonyl-CoA mutase N-terminal domain/subunit